MGMAGSLGHSSHIRSVSDPFDTWISLSLSFLLIFIKIIDLFIYCIYTVCLLF